MDNSPVRPRRRRPAARARQVVGVGSIAGFATLAAVIAANTVDAAPVTATGTTAVTTATTNGSTTATTSSAATSATPGSTSTSTGGVQAHSSSHGS